MSVLRIPDMALVVLVGPSGSGKSTFARRCFAPTQILSSDAFRGMVADDENDQEATAPAFEALHAVAGLRLAKVRERNKPTHALLAGEGAAYVDRDQRWHLDLVDRLVAADPELIRPTAALDVDTTDDASVAAGVAWWEELTAAGGEGMVVKPATGLVRGARRLAQPGIKVRGREYLRLVYGPDYTAPANLARLRDRSVGLKRSLALREYALGVEALERHARGEPLWRVHECVFAVLALESVPVDPQL